jgi:hypothetical protein
MSMRGTPLVVDALLKALLHPFGKHYFLTDLLCFGRGSIINRDL